MRIHRARKFFGRPTGSSPKPQQSKLAFQKPHTTNAAKDEHEEGDGAVKAEDCEEADAVKDDIANEDINMDSNSEVDESALDSKQADPVMNGMKKADSSLANGKGEWIFCVTFASSQTINSVTLRRPYRPYSIWKFVSATQLGPFEAQ